MKFYNLKFIFILVFILLGNYCFSQIKFPNGREKRFTTTLDIVYEETKIPFIYPNNKVTNLSWIAIVDSLPIDWFVMACMNGTCIAGVPETGHFDNFTSLPDTVGFLKYHLNFNDTEGKAKIRFVLFNGMLLGSDTDTATFIITHVKNNIVKQSDQAFNLKVFPNPSSGVWNISGDFKETLYPALLLDMLGRPVATVPVDNRNNTFSLQINNSELKRGIYFLTLQTKNSIQKIRLIKN